MSAALSTYNCMSLCRNKTRRAFSLLSPILSLFLLSVLTNLRPELAFSAEADVTGMSCRWRDVMTLGKVLMEALASFD